MVKKITEEKYLADTLGNQIYPVLSERLAEVLGRIKNSDLVGLEEIRIRADRPLMLHKNSKDYFVSANSNLTCLSSNAFYASGDDVLRSIQLMSNFSVYSIGEELRQGFLTLKGGHRIGFAGRGITENNELKLLKNISSLNIRIAREVIDCSKQLVEALFYNRIGNTLILSPPGCGKTTLLRDMIRLLSNGYDAIGITGNKIGVVDERSELAGCYNGVPQRDVGIRTDVLDACRKVQGITMLLRSMSPEIIAVDEIGSIDDAEAVEEAINSGVFVIATAHGKDIAEAKRKKGVERLIQNRLLDNIVILNRTNGPGTIGEILHY